jgi:predicted transcriptional regulator
MTIRNQHRLSRRERQIMDALYKAGKATAAQVRDALPDAPSYSAVRALLRILEEKGHVRHEEREGRYVYLPRVPRGRARRSALRQLLDTFFDGSPAAAVAALLDETAARVEDRELGRLAELIQKARKEGR